MEPPSSDNSMQRGAEPTYLAMQQLQDHQIYIQMKPRPPKRKIRPPIPFETQVTILPPSNPTKNPLSSPPPPPPPTPLLLPVPPPLPPKKIRRSVSLSPRDLLIKEEQVEQLKTQLQRREDDLLKIWMDLITARKAASRAHHQKHKLQCQITLLICLVILMSLSVMLYFLIRRLMHS